MSAIERIAQGCRGGGKAVAAAICQSGLNLSISCQVGSLLQDSGALLSRYRGTVHQPSTVISTTSKQHRRAWRQSVSQPRTACSALPPPTHTSRHHDNHAARMKPLAASVNYDPQMPPPTPQQDPQTTRLWTTRYGPVLRPCAPAHQWQILSPHSRPHSRTLKHTRFTQQRGPGHSLQFVCQDPSGDSCHTLPYTRRGGRQAGTWPQRALSGCYHPCAATAVIMPLTGANLLLQGANVAQRISTGSITMAQQQHEWKNVTHATHA